MSQREDGLTFGEWQSEDLRTHPHFDREEAAAQMLVAGEMIYPGALLCNDVFAWGCADHEEVSYHELPDLYAAWRDDPNWGTTKWVLKKWGQQPPPPLKKMMIEAGAWSPELEALEPNPASEDRSET